MNDRTQGALLLAVGGIALHLGLTDAALAYVKASLQPLLVASGAGLTLLGLNALRRRPDPHETGHAHGPGVAWLLLVPVLALALLAPPPLGAFAAGRQSSAPPPPPAVADITYPPLDEPEGGAVPIPLQDYAMRALYDSARSLDGVRMRLSGFVTHDEEVEGYLLTRFQVSCCAADAQATSIEIRDDATAWPVDTWLEIEGYWEPVPGHEPGMITEVPGAPRLVADSVTEIDPPAEPYEY
jgi:uncharacterized repeat protein (TIGR03943 family)